MEGLFVTVAVLRVSGLLTKVPGLGGGNFRRFPCSTNISYWKEPGPMPRRASLIVLFGLAVALVLVTSIAAGAQSGDVQEARDEVASAQDRLAEIRMEVSAAEAAHKHPLSERNRLHAQKAPRAAR